MRRIFFALTAMAAALAAPVVGRKVDLQANLFPPPGKMPPRPPRKPKGKTKSRRAWWQASNNYYRVHCDGKGECARRRRQIEAGTLMTTERIQLGLALRRGPVWVGVDYSSEPDRTTYFQGPIVGEVGQQ